MPLCGKCGNPVYATSQVCPVCHARSVLLLRNRTSEEADKEFRSAIYSHMFLCCLLSIPFSFSGSLILWTYVVVAASVSFLRLRKTHRDLKQPEAYYSWLSEDEYQDYRNWLEKK